MRAVVQRVSEASVTIDGEVAGAIGKGVVVLLGVTHGDTGDQGVNFRPLSGCRAAGLPDEDSAALVTSRFTPNAGDR